MSTYRSLIRVFSMFMALLGGILCPTEGSALVWQIPPVTFTTAVNKFDLAADPLGNAFTAWSDTSGNLFVSRFSNAAAAYGPTVTVSSDGGVSQLSIATDASQTALLVWYDEILGQILTSFYNGTTWVTPLPTPLDTIPFLGFSAGPSVSMNGSGNGLAAWRNGNIGTPPGDIIVSFFNGITQTWGALQTLTPTGTGGFAPVSAYSANGTAVVIWEDGSSNLVASNFNGISWTVTPPIIASNIFDGIYDVKMDAAGHALVTYEDSITGDLFSTYYNGTTWSVPVDVSTAPVATTVSMAFSPGGVGFTVWVNAGGMAFYSQFTEAAGGASGSWSAPVQFASNAFEATVAVDSFGNALFAWQDETSHTAFSILKPFGGPLGAPDVVATSVSNLQPILSALADNGRGFVDGLTPVGEGNALLGTFTILPSPTPLIVSASVCTDKFASQSDRINIITWFPSFDPTVANYLLNRNGVLIAVIPASGPFIFLDHNRCKGVTDTYTLTPVDAFGTPLAPPAVIVL